MGFDVDYDKNTKAVKIKNKTGRVTINGVEITTINIDGCNCVNTRELANLLNKNVGYQNGEIQLK